MARSFRSPRMASSSILTSYLRIGSIYRANISKRYITQMSGRQATHRCRGPGRRDPALCPSIRSVGSRRDRGNERAPVREERPRVVADELGSRVDGPVGSPHRGRVIAPPADSSAEGRVAGETVLGAEANAHDLDGPAHAGLANGDLC